MPFFLKSIIHKPFFIKTGSGGRLNYFKSFLSCSLNTCHCDSNGLHILSTFYCFSVLYLSSFPILNPILPILYPSFHIVSSFFPLSPVHLFFRVILTVFFSFSVLYYVTSSFSNPLYLQYNSSLPSLLSFNSSSFPHRFNRLIVSPWRM